MNVDPETVVNAVFHSDIERIRPFIGEKCYYMYIFYQGIMQLIPFYVKKAVESDEEVQPWHESQLVKRMLKVLLSKEELDEIKSNQTSSIARLSMAMESKFIEEIYRIISGQLSADEAKEQVRDYHTGIEEILTSS